MADEATAVSEPILEKTPDEIWQELNVNSQIIACAIAVYGIYVSLEDIEQIVSTTSLEERKQLNITAAMLDLQDKGVLERETDSGKAKKIVENIRPNIDKENLNTFTKEREYGQYLKAKKDLEWFGNDDWSSPTFKLSQKFEEFVLEQF